MRRRTLLAGATAGIGASIAGCLNYFSDSDERSDHWTQLQADAAHTGATTATGPDGGGRVRWSSDTWGVSTGPVIEDGAVYVGSGLRNQAVVAFDQVSGERLWRAPIGDDIERALAVQDGTVYASASGVYALDGETGEQEWMDPVDTS